MARTATAAKISTIEAKALKTAESDGKSAGMRVLFEAGWTVVQVRQFFHAPYGFVYGVAKRGGFADTAAARRAPAKAKAKVVAKKAVATKAATTNSAAKVATPPTTTKSVSVTANRKAARAAAATRRELKAAPAARTAKARLTTKPGRPSPERRAANRAPRTA